MKKLDCTETALKQTKLDFENECEARRRLQQEAQKNREWQERHGRRPFLVALIDADADGYVVRLYARYSESRGICLLTYSTVVVP